jgi:hypothetical protein
MDMMAKSIGSDVRINMQGSRLIRAVDLHKSLELIGNGNDLDLERIAGQITINGYYSGVQQWRTLSGPIHWRGPQTDFSAQALPGDARVSSSDILMTGLTGPVHMNSQSRDIELNDFTESLEMQVNRGDVKLAPGHVNLARVNVSVNAGNVDLAVPDGAHFGINARTNRGSAYSDLGAPFVQESDHQGSTIHGGSGGPSVTIMVQRGEIQLRRGGPAEKSGALTTAPRPPSPPSPASPALPAAKAPQSAPAKTIEQ